MRKLTQVITRMTVHAGDHYEVAEAGHLEEIREGVLRAQIANLITICGEALTQNGQADRM